MPVLGVILAGGQARRMGGRNKTLLKIGTKTVLEHIVERMSSQVDKLLLNTNNSCISADNSCISESAGLTILKDDLEVVNGIGPMVGIYTALDHAKNNGFTRVLTVAGDTPFIPDNFFSKLDRQNETRASVARSNGRIHPILGLWHVSLLDELGRRIERQEYKMMDFIADIPAAVVDWDDKPDPFFNINTEEDLKIARQLYHTDRLSK